MAAGGKVRLGSKPTAVIDQPTAEGAAKTNTQGQRLQRGAQSPVEARQARARARRQKSAWVFSRELTVSVSHCDNSSQ